VTHLRLLSCSWPRPVECDDIPRWTSEPEWNAPVMPGRPAVATKIVEGAAAQLIDWRGFFGEDVRVWGDHRTGEMKKFHVVFRVRVERGGTLVFFDDDGCIIRRDGEVIHEDREVHPLRRHELAVRAGDTLEIAQWQFHGDWLWGGRVEPAAPSLDDDVALFAPFREEIERALRNPNGPVLKTYFAATHPVRAALTIHGLILNGFRPAGVQIYGDYQWDASRRRAVEALLPFAEIIPTQRVLQSIHELDGRLLPLAQKYWSAMKLCVTLLEPPDEFCFLDDDVFVLDRMDDALTLFRDHDLVYQTDHDHGESYTNIWQVTPPLDTGNVNTGICFVRNLHDRRVQAERLVTNPPNGHLVWLWEQGFVAAEFARKRTIALPTQRYFYPIFDGLPGGIEAYDWGANPCGFATAHFGGLQNKPTEDQARALVRDILARRRAA
jgi:hypothetical protein